MVKKLQLAVGGVGSDPGSGDLLEKEMASYLGL